MSWTVGDELDEISIFPTIFSWSAPVEEFANFIDYFEVVPFVATADIVGFSAFTLMVNEVDGFAVVKDIKPVPNIVAGAVEGDGFFRKAFTDDCGDEFFGMLLGTVVVGAVAGSDIHAIGVVICPNDVVG